MADCYVENRGTGSFIIVYPTTNFTLAVAQVGEDGDLVPRRDQFDAGMGSDVAGAAREEDHHGFPWLDGRILAALMGAITNP